MDVVIIEDQAIIADSIQLDFDNCSNKTLSVTVLSSLAEIQSFDFSNTQYIVSDLYLGTSIYDTFVALHEVKSHFPQISISIFTQSTEVSLLPALLSIINADHLFCKRFDNHIAETVLNGPTQSFFAPAQDVRRATKLLNLDPNTQSIFKLLASHCNVTSIALEKRRSKSAISQALRKAEIHICSKEKLMRLFQRD
ncbi:hypothetical protein FG064_16375 [Vibrio cholerae]|nr:hypothetical protein [Vibrio cholerae]